MNMAVTECDINIIETDAINGVGTTAFNFEKNRFVTKIFIYSEQILMFFDYYFSF